MKLYDQTTFSDKSAGTKGDCMVACMKTIIQSALEGVENPPVVQASGRTWTTTLEEQLASYGYEFRYSIKLDPGAPRYVLANGTTIRTATNGVRHSVVWDTLENKMLHDPHPSRAGLLVVEDYFYLEPLVANDNAKAKDALVA